MSVNSLNNLKYLREDFLNYCKDKGVIDFVLKHFNLPLPHVDENGIQGIEIQSYPNEYYFSEGGLKDHIKEGRWFCSEKLRNKFLTSYQRGNFLTLLSCAKDIASLIYIFHDAGLVIDDLSCTTVLADPESGKAFFVSWDSVHKYDERPDHILPTPDFVAPEQITKRDIYNFPTYLSNNHALAVLIYFLLLHRHPLRGKKIFDEDPSRDEELCLGERALFIEHPGDRTNEVDVRRLMSSELPYGNPRERPYTLLGTHLARLIILAFVEALHIPNSRPTPKDWLLAIDKTQYTLITCQNHECEEKYFVFREGNKGKCPYCGKVIDGIFPVFNCYSRKGEGKYTYDGFRIIGRDGMVIPCHLLYSDKSEDPWAIINVHDGISLSLRENKWFIVNNSIESLVIINGNNKVKIGQNHNLPIEDGMKIVIEDPNGKLLIVQFLKYQ